MKHTLTNATNMSNSPLFSRFLTPRGSVSNFRIIVLISLVIFSMRILAVPVGTAFNYQGELFDNGAGANGQYNFRVDVFTNNNFFGAPLFFNDISIVNGLFNLPSIEIGIDAFTGEEVFLRIAVKKINEANYTLLNPIQRISAVPYSTYAQNSELSVFAENAISADTATFAESANNSNTATTALRANSAFIADTIIQNGAQIGQYLQYSGQQGWMPADVNIPEPSPWVENASTISQNDTNKRVGIGVISPNAKLHINAAIGETPFRVQSLGSTKLVVTNNGRVGLNEFNPTATLDVKSSAGEMAFRVRTGNTTHVSVNADGNTIISNSLSVVASSTVLGDMYQDGNSNGLPKYFVDFFCSDDTPITTINKQHSTTLAIGNISIRSLALGKCELTFPTNILDRYFSYVDLDFLGSGLIRNNTCELTTANTIVCENYNFSGKRQSNYIVEFCCFAKFLGRSFS